MASEHPDLVEKYDITQAPTLILFTEKGYEKFAGAGAITQMLRHTA